MWELNCRDEIGYYLELWLLLGVGNSRKALLSPRVKPGPEVRGAVLALLPLRELLLLSNTSLAHVGKGCAGSNFSSSADEPQIPHGEILIPFFQCSVKTTSQ